MTDTVNKKPLRVSTESSAGPYIRLPLSQVDDVRRLLEGNGITYYWVDEDALSWNGGPFMTYIKFGHNGDAALVQSVLDSAPDVREDLMALADDIRALRDRTLAELIGAHDYYADTKIAWKIVNDAIAAGETFGSRNATTGTVTTHVELSAKAVGYVDRQLTEATFQQFIAIFESFIFDLLRLWLTAFPQNLMGKKVDFKDVLEAPDKDAITLLVVNKELNELLYERPANWFAYLEDKVKLGCPTADEIDRFTEAKASRDVLIHNRGVVGKIYLAKAGTLARHTLGQRIDIPEPYHRQIWQMLHNVVANVGDATIAKSP